jgi:NCS2 family nucleobase:cation symporter-2/xanthine permease XanP
MFAGIVTPALIVGGALAFDVGTQATMVAMALFTSGLATLVQVRRFGPVGSGLLSVQGTSFTFVRPALQAGQAGGLPLILGMSLLAAPAEMAVSRLWGRVGRFFPPVVTGTAVTLIGLSLINVGMTDFAGGRGASDFGSLTNLGLASLVLVVIVAFNRWGRGIFRTGSVMIGILVGYAVAAVAGRIDFDPWWTAGWFTAPVPLKYGLAFDLKYLLPWVLAYLVTSVETVGDLTATSLVSNQPVSGPVYRRRIAGGTLGDACGSMVAALLNALPNTTFSQNNGVIQMTGVASRRVGLMVAAILVSLGLCPKLGMFVSLMPKPVLGGATLALFGTVAAAGIRLLSLSGLASREMLIVALALGLGLGIEMVPDVLSHLPELVQITFGSGLVTGTLVAMALNLLLPEQSPAAGGKTTPQ